MTQFDKRNISMMMDLYEMTMANGYFANQQKPQKVVFDVFYRKNPDQGGYAVFAGLEQVVEYAENLHFDSADMDYFRSLNLFSEEFLQYLKEFRFTGDIYAFPEGTVMYPNEPVITVVAPLIDAQLIETAILTSITNPLLRPRPAGLSGQRRDAVSRILEQGGRIILMRQSTAQEQHISVELPVRPP